MKKTMIVIACAWGLGFSAVNAGATNIQLGAPGTSFDDYSSYVGSINDSIPSNEADEAAYINWLITLATGAASIQLPGTDPANDEWYNRVGSTLAGPFATAVALGASKIDDPESNLGINVTGFTYILAKYDAGGGGALVWVVNGGGLVDVPTSFNGHDLGHVTLFNAASVPDGGTTLMLLGGALVALGALRRKFSL